MTPSKHPVTAVIELAAVLATEVCEDWCSLVDGEIKHTKICLARQSKMDAAEQWLTAIERRQEKCDHGFCTKDSSFFGDEQEGFILYRSDFCPKCGKELR